MEPEELAEIRRTAESGEKGLDRLKALRRGTEFWTKLMMDAVKLSRKQGATWAEIGKALGISAQAAHERFTKGRLRITVE